MLTAYSRLKLCYYWLLVAEAFAAGGVLCSPWFAVGEVSFSVWATTPDELAPCAAVYSRHLGYACLCTHQASLHLMHKAGLVLCGCTALSVVALLGQLANLERKLLQLETGAALLRSCIDTDKLHVASSFFMAIGVLAWFNALDRSGSLTSVELRPCEGAFATLAGTFCLAVAGLYYWGAARPAYLAEARR